MNSVTFQCRTINWGLRYILPFIIYNSIGVAYIIMVSDNNPMIEVALINGILIIYMVRIYIMRIRKLTIDDDCIIIEYRFKSYKELRIDYVYEVKKKYTRTLRVYKTLTLINILTNKRHVVVSYDWDDFDSIISLLRREA